MKCSLVFCALTMAASTTSAQWVTAEHRQVCKATIGALFGRNPAIIKIDRIEGYEVYLSYRRPDDGTRWSYKCILEGRRVMWGGADGRWRNDPADEIVEYTTTPQEVIITHFFLSEPASKVVNRYKRSQLGS